MLADARPTSTRSTTPAPSPPLAPTTRSPACSAASRRRSMIASATSGEHDGQRRRARRRTAEVAEVVERQDARIGRADRLLDDLGQDDHASRSPRRHARPARSRARRTGYAVGASHDHGHAEHRHRPDPVVQDRSRRRAATRRPPRYRSAGPPCSKVTPPTSSSGRRPAISATAPPPHCVDRPRTVAASAVAHDSTSSVLSHLVCSTPGRAGAMMRAG